ncbi:ABC transporter ATP-binding protein [Tropicimonas sp. IMCC34043]|uniref:ABC transporter ATP-binding protein n=1 Tax=Tropicimonas sp. IMCC34043 TaxID=2248760 RepID=UPI000E264A7C|nr:sn-glycerol-3-phosphate ABC transporter ATP-binding protein UgpC [Tropicimonas sp. IMCC34043]
MAGVVLNNVVKRFGEIEVIHGVDLDIADGEFCVFVGPSGCGKSTLLRMVAGLEATTKGAIQIGERDVTRLDPSERGVAMVFQTYALYPHMTVAENMGFGLKMTGHPKDVITQKVSEASAILKLDPYLDRRPKALSGGQRQRVAIGRAIVRGPDVFLFDEPLSNLDAELRVEMRVEIARLHKEIGATMIYVTHDQTEAMTLANKIVVLRDGRVEQVGAPLELYRDPDNRFVAGFIGSPAMNFCPGKVVDGKVKVPGLGAEPLSPRVRLPATGTEVVVGVRPQKLHVVPDGSTHKVEMMEALGGVSYVYLQGAGERIICEMHSEDVYSSGQTVGIAFEDEDLMVFDATSERRIR